MILITVRLGGGADYTNQVILKSCSELNAHWKTKSGSLDALNNVSAISMQIAAGAVCGISDKSVLTELRSLADNVAEESEKCLFDKPLDDYSQGISIFYEHD